jgi:hypothetical protein
LQSLVQLPLVVNGGKVAPMFKHMQIGFLRDRVVFFNADFASKAPASEC